MTEDELIRIATAAVKAAVGAQPSRPPALDQAIAGITKLRDECNAILALLGEPAPAAEQEKPVEPPKPNPPIVEPLPIPPSLTEPEEKKPSKWRKFGRILMSVGKVAGSVAVIAGVPGAGLVEYAPDIINAIASPGGTLGVATLAGAGVKVYEELKKKE